MARSTFIYVVQRRATGGLITAFTVKHELKSWLDKQDEQFKHGLHVARVYDAQFRPGITYLNVHTLDAVATLPRSEVM